MKHAMQAITFQRGGVTAAKAAPARAVSTPSGDAALADGRFALGRRLGAGGMGIVHEAYDREQRTRVAIKLLRAMDAGALYRFKQEFRLVQGIEHPNLVSLGELIEDRGRWFFTMELIEGIDLLRHVRPAPDGTLGTEPTLPGDDNPAPIARPRFHEQRLRSALDQIA